MHRKDLLVTGEIYHVYNKSIAGFKIFSGEEEFLRIKNMIRYYRLEGAPFKFSKFANLKQVETKGFAQYFEYIYGHMDKLVSILAYCIMPTHLHLILKQLKNDGISIFMSNVLNSYARYFNTKLERKGPLWEGRFKNVLVKSDEQLLHLTRYLHLNPVTAHIVERPEQWTASSYLEYLWQVPASEKMCRYEDVLDIEPGWYRGFVEDRIAYQRELALVKNLLLE